MVAAFEKQDRLPIDLVQALRQLQTLGYADGDTVYLRSFPPKKAKGIPKNSQFTMPHVPVMQDANGGLYLVVNGGGQPDADVI